MDIHRFAKGYRHKLCFALSSPVLESSLMKSTTDSTGRAARENALI